MEKQPNDTTSQGLVSLLAHSQSVSGAGVLHTVNDALWDEIRCRQTGAGEKRLQQHGEASAQPMRGRILQQRRRGEEAAGSRQAQQKERGANLPYLTSPPHMLIV